MDETEPLQAPGAYPVAGQVGDKDALSVAYQDNIHCTGSVDKNSQLPSGLPGEGGECF